MENEELKLRALNCINDIKKVMAKHGTKGKVKVILAAYSLWYLDSFNYPFIEEHVFGKWNDKVQIVNLLPKYFDFKTWQEINKMFITTEYEREVYKCAALIAERPKKKEKLKLVEEIINAFNYGGKY